MNESIRLSEINLKKASELVQTFKKVAVNQSVEELEEFSVRGQIQEVIDTLEPKLRGRQAIINLDIPDSLKISSYPGSFYQIISNLIMNTLIHAFPERDGEIDISVNENKDDLDIYFKDNGVGMNTETQQKIFDPFYTTKRGSGGTGLGMYMIYNIVTQRLGGTIEVESEIEKGTQFHLILPKSPPEEDDSSSHSNIYKV